MAIPECWGPSAMLDTHTTSYISGREHTSIFQAKEPDYGNMRY